MEAMQAVAEAPVSWSISITTLNLWNTGLCKMPMEATHRLWPRSSEHRRTVLRQQPPESGLPTKVMNAGAGRGHLQQPEYRHAGLTQQLLARQAASCRRRLEHCHSGLDLQQPGPDAHACRLHQCKMGATRIPVLVEPARARACACPASSLPYCSRAGHLGAEFLLHCVLCAVHCCVPAGCGWCTRTREL